MIDATYVTQATTWLVVWSAGGAWLRLHLAKQERRRQDRAAR